MEEEKTLTLKSLKKETDIKFAELEAKVDALSKDIEIIKKVLTK